MDSTNWQDMTDFDLIKSCIPDNQHAFEALYHRYEKRVFRYLLTMVADAALAEEILVEVMLAVWKGLTTFQGQSKVSTWIFGIAHHKAVDGLRKVTSQQRGSIPIENIAESPDPHDGPLEETNKNRLAELTNQAMLNLSSDHREILHLTFHEGQSYPEISELLGIPVNTVKTRVYYAKQQMKKTLQHQGVTEDIL